MGIRNWLFGRSARIDELEKQIDELEATLADEEAGHQETLRLWQVTRDEVVRLNDKVADIHKEAGKLKLERDVTVGGLKELEAALELKHQRVLAVDAENQTLSGTVASLRNENQRLQKLLDGDSAEIELHLNKLEAREDIKHWSVYLLAASYLRTMKEHGADNFLIMQMVDTGTGTPLEVTIQKRDGKTVGEMYGRYKDSHDRFVQAATKFIRYLATDYPERTRNEGYWELEGALKEADKLDAESKAQAA